MSDQQPDKQPKDKQVSAYDRVMARLHSSLTGAEKNSWEYLQKKIEEAVELELTAEEMTRDEMDLLTAYVKRDMKQLGYYAHETGEGIAAWLHFDLNILEARMKALLLGLADKTRIQQEELRERLDHGEDQYLSGELATAGTLACLECGETQVLRETAVIGACDRCGGRYFHRIFQPWSQEDA